MLAIISVLVFPPKESCNIRVNFEFRNGTWPTFQETKTLITFPRADSDKLILLASFKCCPLACVLDYLSDPAKSIKCNFDYLIIC